MFKKYTLFWLFVTGIAIFFSVGILLKIAFGVTYLHDPVVIIDSVSGYTALQVFMGVFASLVAAVMVLENCHLKKS